MLRSAMRADQKTLLRKGVFLAALSLLALIALQAGSAAAAPGDSTADHVYGQGGSFASSSCNLGGSDTSLCNPWGVATDSAGRLWVADSNNDRVLEYDNPLGSSVATRIFPLGAGALPTGIAFDSSGRLYVAASNSRILQLDTPLTSSVVSRTLVLPPGTYPLGLAMDGADRLYLGDAYFSRVLEYDTPVTSSVVSHNIGLSSGSVPTGVAVDLAGHLYAADAGNHRVLEYDTPLASSTPNRVFGQPGFTGGTCNHGGLSASSLCSPIGISVDASGNLFVADRDNSRVLAYNHPLGNCATCDTAADQVFGQGGSMTTNACNSGGITANSLCSMQDAYANSNGSVWIADSANNRLLEYDGSGCSPAPLPVSGSVPPGGTLSTDPSNGGATACQTLQVSVTSPTGGPITINVTTNPGPVQKQASITAPSASSANPMTLVFTIDSSIVPAGFNQNNLGVFKDGVHVFDCATGSGAAAPDPCVSSRALVSGGDIQFVVLTSSASVWSFGPFSSVGGLTEVLTSNSSRLPWLALLVAVAAAVAALSVAGWRLRLNAR